MGAAVGLKLAAEGALVSGEIGATPAALEHLLGQPVNSQSLR